MQYNKDKLQIRGVKGIIISNIKPDKYLLAQHNNPEIIGKWTFLGGHIEENDKSYEQTLKRELYEELELDIKIFKEIGSFEYKEKHRIYYVLAAIALNIPHITSDEILNIDWFSYDQILEMNSENKLQTKFEIPALNLYLQNS
jgi:8-oxo-dGTP pyrophosphatase MutT (NUDIX family)